jgi:hypothetical protein
MCQAAGVNQMAARCVPVMDQYPCWPLGDLPVAVDACGGGQFDGGDIAPVMHTEEGHAPAGAVPRGT